MAHAGTIRPLSHRSLFAFTFFLLVGVAWVTLFLWEHSAYGRYLSHGDWTKAGLAASICSSLPAGEWLLPATLYVGGWLLMLAAMMLPTTLPLLEIFRRGVRNRPDAAILVALLMAGYLAAWTGFGIAAHGIDWVVHDVAQSNAWLMFNGWAIGATVIGLAGIFQFTPLKKRCLERCRTPLSFVLRHWVGKASRRRAFLLGLDHGLFCVGCCWALMLLMFVVGVGSVGWMLALGAVMAVEKNFRWGHRLSSPLGVMLLAWAGVIWSQQSLA